MRDIDVFNNLPVAINNCFGDPLEYIDNTIEKLRKLKDHQGPVCIITKHVIFENMLERLQSEFSNYKSLVLFYTITGLNEGGWSFQQRYDSFIRLAGSFKNVALYYRPIFKGQNDSPEMIERIVSLAAMTGRPLVYGGSKIGFSKFLDEKTEVAILSNCSKQKVMVFQKTSCCTAYMLENKICATHVNDDNASANLDIVEKFGYPFDIVNHKVHLKKASRGDRSFIRFITNSNPLIDEVDYTTAVLAFSRPDKRFEVTSSWFIWANNFSRCRIACEYCVIQMIDLKKQMLEIGCEPRDLISYFK